MPSPKKQIETALGELERLYKSRDRIEKQREKEMQPHQVAFDEATKEIREKFDGKAAPVNGRIAALETEVKAQMMLKQDAEGNLTLTKVKSGNLTAEATFTERRTINPEQFFNFAKAKAGIWKCFSVFVGEAEKLVGKTELNKLAKPKRSWSVSIKSK